MYKKEKIMEKNKQRVIRLFGDEYGIIIDEDIERAEYTILCKDETLDLIKAMYEVIFKINIMGNINRYISTFEKVENGFTFTARGGYDIIDLNLLGGNGSGAMKKLIEDNIEVFQMFKRQNYVKDWLENREMKNTFKINYLFNLYIDKIKKDIIHFVE